MLLPLGVDASMSPYMPFGVRWEDDVAALGEVSLAIDVGANEGQTAARIIQAFPSARVFSYEPVPSTFDVLQRRYAGSKQVTCIRAALAAEPGNASMINGLVSGQNTLLIDAKPDEPTVVVPLTTLALQAAEHGWGQIDLLKIDTEGFEIEVLRGGLSLLKRGTVRFVLAECDFAARPVDPHAYFPDVLALLEPLGYRVVAFYTAAVDGLGWVWGDVLFMRESLSRQVLFTPNGHQEYIAT